MAPPEVNGAEAAAAGAAAAAEAAAGAASGASAAAASRREMLILRTCREVCVHRDCCSNLRDGYSPSCGVLAATAEQQQQQAAAAAAGEGPLVGPRRRLGFVPTLGGLHQGHISLIRAARRMCDEVWVSIFLNPTQFQRQEDFESYPMNIDEDITMLRATGLVDVLFLPTAAEMYPHYNAAAPAAAAAVAAAAPPVGCKLQGAPFAHLLLNFDRIEAVRGEGMRRPGFFSGETAAAATALAAAVAAAVAAAAAATTAAAAL